MATKGSSRKIKENEASRMKIVPTMASQRLMTK